MDSWDFYKQFKTNSMAYFTVYLLIKEACNLQYYHILITFLWINYKSIIIKYMLSYKRGQNISKYSPFTPLVK